MKVNYTISSIYHIARADFLQRVRSYLFLITLGASVFTMYSFVPPISAGYKIMLLGNYRGLYNSAWIGTMVGMCAPLFALIGFYLVNYSVKRDIDTRVGQIIATTPISKVQYLFGKMISNFAVLLVIFIVIVVMTIVMFLIRGETRHLELGKLLYPLLIFTIPSLFITAALALFFDSFTGLSRGVINIGYFVLWVLIMSSKNHVDVFGFFSGTTEIEHVLMAAHPDWNGGNSLCLIPSDPGFNSNIFIYDGLKWSSTVILNRIFWMSCAFCLVLVASIGFNRFDSFRIREFRSKSTGTQKNKTAWFRNFGVTFLERFPGISVVGGRFSHLVLVQAELRLMLKGNSIWWLIVSIGLFIASIFAPMDFAYKIALPLLWFFQVLIISKLGFREATHRCREYIFSAAFPLMRQLPATLSAAVLLMIILAFPVTLRLLLTGNLYSVYAIIVGALFIPSFAITSGILTGGSKLFEVIFAIMMDGFLNKVPFFDFIGAIGGSHELGIPHYLLIITFVLVILAFEGRKRQILHT